MISSIRPRLFAAALLASLAGVAPAASGEVPVQLILDMDAAAPGMQSQVEVPAGETVVRGVAVYLVDPLAARSLWGIGYLGGIDRGIALGHVPNAANRGAVIELVPTAGAASNPGNTPWPFTAPGVDPGFPGLEVQYVEAGASAPATISAAPAAPLFTVDIGLRGAEAGDVFDFYLLDFVTVWSGGQGGAFSTTGPLALDSGGDAVPDSTRTLHGVDPDVAIPAPPAAFLVDLIDGGAAPGPAVVRVLAASGVAAGASVQALALSPASPNPMSRSARVRFDVPFGVPARLSVVDASGRLVRVLAARPAGSGPGSETAIWDGRDMRGRESPAGVYFLRLEAPGEVRSERITRLPR